MGKQKIHWCPICNRNVRHGDTVHGIQARKDRLSRKQKTAAKTEEKKK